MADISERIEKQMEGNSLALAAVAEVLQKMDSRLAKEDAIEYEEIQKQHAISEQQGLVKAVATEVFNLLKEGTKTEEKGLDVSGDSRSAKSTGKSASSADDSEKGAPIGTKIEDQQKTIQAAILALKKEEEEEEDEDFDKYSKQDDEEEDKPDFPVEEKGEDEEKDPDDDMDEMKMQLDALKKQIAAYEANMEKAVSNEAEGRLRKMGFREERGLVAPTLTSGDGLGVDGSLTSSSRY
ncbi:uncharacterized protein METZ01_LOCUS379847 [marine metagenome]|uniref:Uncharacterized protein n=1 Tax=marine metagenome TaxID=408172 RepID=A0A382TYA3_9ZZZZ